MLPYLAAWSIYITTSRGNFSCHDNWPGFIYGHGGLLGNDTNGIASSRPHYLRQHCPKESLPQVAMTSVIATMVLVAIVMLL